MIRGAQKQMIVLRTGNSPYFDEAYFVLRREVRSEQSNRVDILAEANKILEENTRGARRGARCRASGWLIFLAGLLCGGLGSMTVCLILL